MAFIFWCQDSVNFAVCLKFTTITVNGQVSFDQIINALKIEYTGQPSLNVLWDCTNGMLKHITTDQVKAILSFVENIAEGRRGGKTAFVGDKNFEFGLMRMYGTLAEMAEIPFQVEVFRSMAEALQWLDQPST
jgi:hypothetical protein